MISWHSTREQGSTSMFTHTNSCLVWLAAQQQRTTDSHDAHMYTSSMMGRETIITDWGKLGVPCLLTMFCLLLAAAETTSGTTPCICYSSCKPQLSAGLHCCRSAKFQRLADMNRESRHEHAPTDWKWSLCLGSIPLVLRHAMDLLVVLLYCACSAADQQRAKIGLT